MLRFVAFRWRDHDPGSRAAAAAGMRRLKDKGDWEETLSGPGFAVLHTGGARGSFRVHRIGDRSGAIFGNVFRRRAPMGRCDPAQFLHAGPSTGGSAVLFASLVRDYWGSYVAVIVNSDVPSLEVLRDPIGGFPCFLASSPTVNVAFSYVEDCLATGLFEVSIDWSFVRRHLAGAVQRNETTGVSGFSELQPGRRASLGDSGIGGRETLWSGEWWADALDGEADDQVLRDTTRACVGAWASLHDRILHRLSGGLDSSIVLSCLCSSHDRNSISCVNVYGEGSAQGDERPFARLSARAHGVRLHECAARNDVKLEPIVSSPRFARPMDYQGQLRRREIDEPLARRLGASAIFGGTGGDQIFNRRHPLLAAADRLRHGGATPAFFRYAQSVARSQRLSLWRVLQGAMRDERPRSLPPAAVSLVSRAVREEAAVQIGESRPSLAKLPPGKRSHVRSCAVAHMPYSSVGLESTAEAVLPLLSQPLVELCLGIPSYVLTADGIDRGLARRAFSNDIPAAIVNRTRKGSSDAHLEKLLTGNLSFVRQFLLDGTLVKEGLLDRGKLEQALTPASAAKGRCAGEVLCRHLNTEVWLHTWLRSPSQTHS